MGGELLLAKFTTDFEIERGYSLMPATHQCFDDALDFISYSLMNHRPVVVSMSAYASTFLLVHGICLDIRDEPFAHAWVEHGGSVWQGGRLPDGKVAYYPLSPADFEKSLPIVECTRYTVEQAMRQNWQTNNYGPWVEKYRALCGRGAPEKILEDGAL